MMLMKVRSSPLDASSSRRATACPASCTATRCSSAGPSWGKESGRPGGPGVTSASGSACAIGRFMWRARRAAPRTKNSTSAPVQPKASTARTRRSTSSATLPSPFNSCEVIAEDPLQPVDARERNGHHLVEPAGATQRGIDLFGVVRGSNQDHGLACHDALDLLEHGVNDFGLILSVVTLERLPVSDAVDLVEKQIVGEYRRASAKSERMARRWASRYPADCQRARRWRSRS